MLSFICSSSKMFHQIPCIRIHKFVKVLCYQVQNLILIVFFIRKTWSQYVKICNSKNITNALNEATSAPNSHWVEFTGALHETSSIITYKVLYPEALMKYVEVVNFFPLCKEIIQMNKSDDKAPLSSYGNWLR